MARQLGVNGVVDLPAADDLAGLCSVASRSDEPGVLCSPMVHARRSPRFAQSAPAAENDSAGTAGVAGGL